MHVLLLLLLYLYDCVLSEWKSDLTPVVVEPFLQPTGLAVEMSGDPADMFSLFFTPDIISEIVEETNRYAAQCLEGLQRSWTTDDEEVRAYLGFYILMGLVQEPEIRDYWSVSPTFHYPAIASRISRRRFEEISRYLHFVDRESLPSRGTPNHEPLQRVRPILNALRERFSAVYHPQCQLSVDEAMIPFKGVYVTCIHVNIHKENIHKCI